MDLELLASLLWVLVSFVCVRRHLKSGAKALVLCAFKALAVQHPDLFRNVLVQESRTFLRHEVFQAWTFQRTIDVYSGGGLDCEACNGMRSGVEELPKRAVGCVPCGSSAGKTARELQKHAAEVHHPHIQESTSQHGPSFHFEFQTLACFWMATD